jgi:methyl-coenzyme M reductase gamma subunit
MELDCRDEYKFEKLEYNDIIQHFDLEGYLEKKIKEIYSYVIDLDNVKTLKNEISVFNEDSTIWDFYKQRLKVIESYLSRDPLKNFNLAEHFGRKSMVIAVFLEMRDYPPLCDYIKKKTAFKYPSKEKTIFKVICAFVVLAFDKYLEDYPPIKRVQAIEERVAKRETNGIINKFKAILGKKKLPIEEYIPNRELLQNALMQEIKKDYFLTRPCSWAQYAQYTAGSSNVAENRRKYMNPNYKLEKLRDIAEEDIVRLLAHRAPGEEYKSIHPPLEEMEEPDCAVRQMVTPTEGAAAGDRIRYVQYTDSMFFAPITPYLRAQNAYTRYRGVDAGVNSGSMIIEGRERDIEKIAKEQIDSVLFDVARTGLRGRTVLGHAVRLDEDGMMFDALRRWVVDERTGEVKYVKDMIGGAMDKEVTLGKPMLEDELRKRTTMYRNAQGGLWQEEDDPEAMDVTAEIHWKRTVGGFQPWAKMSDIEGGKKDVGVKNLKLFVPRGGVE